jgi:hypothetical protein
MALQTSNEEDNSTRNSKEIWGSQGEADKDSSLSSCYAMSTGR